MREIVKLIDIVATTVEDDADSAVSHLADTSAYALSKAFVTRRLVVL